MKVSRRKNRFAPRVSRPTPPHAFRLLLDKAFMNPRLREMIYQGVGKNNALLQRIKLKETVK